ncbi:MAG: hypothetical protein LBL24_01785 [Bacteroidales bacterium]|nr:hypothetical protein [Bacteroidales bacterium]
MKIYVFSVICCIVTSLPAGAQCNMQQKLAMESGIFAMRRQEKHLPPMGFLYGMNYSRLPCGKWGLGGGLVLVHNMEDHKYYALTTYAVFRQYLGTGFVYEEVSSLGDLLMDAILFILPRQVEFDMGASVGWFTADRPHGSLRLRQRFAPSVDMQCKMIFTVWRLGLTAGMGVSCMLAKNFEGRDNFNSRLVIKGIIGLSYHF